MCIPSSLHMTLLCALVQLNCAVVQLNTHDTLETYRMIKFVMSSYTFYHHFGITAATRKSAHPLCMYACTLCIFHILNLLL